MSRYIDADALKKRAFNYYECVNEDTCKGNYRGDTLMDYEFADMIEDCIDNAPTADVVEVRRGRWVLVRPRITGRNATYRCTVCKKLRSSYYNDVQEWEYCPCGAKMDGERIEP